MRRVLRTHLIRSVSQLQQGRLPLELHTGSPPVALPVPEVKSIAADFPPAQQIALLTLRNSELCQAVLAKLRHSTVRASARDYYDLERRRLVERQANGMHKLTPLGHFKANAVAKELADTFGIKLQPFIRSQKPSMYTAGVKANFNFW